MFQKIGSRTLLSFCVVPVADDIITRRLMLRVRVQALRRESSFLRATESLCLKLDILARSASVVKTQGISPEEVGFIEAAPQRRCMLRQEVFAAGNSIAPAAPCVNVRPSVREVPLVSAESYIALSTCYEPVKYSKHFGVCCVVGVHEPDVTPA